jgi:hypothetical protein
MNQEPDGLTRAIALMEEALDLLVDPEDGVVAMRLSRSRSCAGTSEREAPFGLTHRLLAGTIGDAVRRSPRRRPRWARFEYGPEPRIRAN